ncbi:MAG: lipocalin family protein [Ginsengibacter sp.]
MRKLLPLITLTFIYSCTSMVEPENQKIITEDVRVKDTFNLLCQYWELDDADNPGKKDIAYKENGISYSSGINFSVDSTLLENPKGAMTYGNYSLDHNTINAKYDDGRKVTYKILKLNDSALVLRRKGKEKDAQLYYQATNTYWPNPKENAFSKNNYSWVKKPNKEESPEEIKNRAKQCIQFYAYYFKGFANGKAKKITFKNVPSCFEWYEGGIFMQTENKLDKKWIDCFYSSDQAFQARQLLEDVLMKKYDWDTTQTSWVKQTSLMLQQIHDKM